MQYPPHTQQYLGQWAYGHHSSVPIQPNSTAPQPSGPFYEDSNATLPSSDQLAYPPYNTNHRLPTTNPHGYTALSPTSPMNYAQTRLQQGNSIGRPQSAMPYSSQLSLASLYPSHSYSPHTAQQQPSLVFVPSSPYKVEPQYTGSSDSSVRPFACDLCSLSFNRQHDLKRHRETHTGEKPFICNGGCGKTFTRKDALKRHQVSIIWVVSDACFCWS
jgi:uncharacterized Zn-finger protein